MAKPFLELTAEERNSVVRVEAIRVPIGVEHVFWDVFLFSIGASEALAHEAPPADRGTGDDIEGLASYVDYYLALLGLERVEPFVATATGLRARVQRIDGNVAMLP